MFLASVEVSQARGDFVPVARSRISVTEWAEQWLATQVQFKPSTRHGYESIVRSAIIPRWGSTPLSGECGCAEVATHFGGPGGARLPY